MKLGQQNGLSVVDKQQVNQLYKCSNNRGKFIAYRGKGSVRSDFEHLEKFSIECRNTKIKVFTLTNHM